MNSTSPNPSNESSSRAVSSNPAEEPPQAGFSSELVREYYSGLYCFGLSTLGSQVAARQAALQVLAEACQNRNALAAGGRLWLYNTALREFRHQKSAYSADAEAPPTAAIGFEASLRKLVDRWDNQERQTAALYYLLQWPAAEIAALLKVGSGAVQAQIDLFRSTFASLPGESAHKNLPATERIQTPGVPALTPAEARAVTYLQSRWPVSPLVEEEIGNLAEQVDAQCTTSAMPASRFPSVWGVWAAGGLLVLILAVIAGSFIGGLLFQRSLLSFPATSTLTPVPAFAQPTPFPPVPSVEPLSRLSTQSEIVERWQNSPALWNSITIDIQTVDYGPPSYIGPPRRYRSQGWALQPDNGIQLTGLLSQPAGQVNLVGSGRIFTRSYISGRSSSREWSTRVNALIPDDPLRSMVFPVASPWFQREGSFWWAASSEMLGRRVEIFDWLNHLNEPEARLYIDAQTGIILREQIFTGEGFETLRRESVVTDLQFEHREPPPALIVAAQQSQEQAPSSGFLPLQATPTLALPATSRPPLPLDPAPAGMDPSRSRLLFQFADEPSISERRSSTADVPTLLFAGGYFLGETRFGLPWAMRCTRSPDGSRLAFNTASDGASPADDGLHWFRLSEPARVYQPMPGFHANAFAFSPNARSLAAVGDYDSTGEGDAGPKDGLYRVDLALGEAELLIELYDARSLVWSPDGLFIALIGRLPGEEQPAVLVVNVGARLVIYQGEPGVFGPTAPADSPIPGWNVAFPTTMGDMETCAAPP